MLFTEDYSGTDPEDLKEIMVRRARLSGIPRIVVTLGERGAVYADKNGESGVCPALRVDVVDTTGAGDAFFAGVAIGLTYGKTVGESCGVAIGLTYGKTVGESCVIGTRLAASVIASRENVCPRFRPEEFGIHIEDKQ